MTASSVRRTRGGTADGWYRLGGPMLARLVKRSVTDDLRRLKRILETDA